MLSRRSFGMMSTLPLIALGLASESSASSASAASATAPRPLAETGRYQGAGSGGECSARCRGRV